MWKARALLITTHLLVPAWLLFWMATCIGTSEVEWLLWSSMTGAFVLFLFLVGRWDWVSWYLRYALVGAFALTFACCSRRSLLGYGHAPPSHHWAFLSVEVVLLFLFLFLDLSALRGYFFSDPPILVHFPLGDGLYYVGQGGNSQLINAHQKVLAQRYAVDVVRVSRLGTRPPNAGPPCHPRRRSENTYRRA